MKLSIVIPNYNGRELLAKNLPAVLAACSGSEIIAVDDASTDGSVTFLQKNFPTVRIVRHQKNQRFAASCNDGVKVARGKIVVLLNNDVVPEKDFLKPLLAVFTPDVFAVGCREKRQENGRWVNSGRGLMKFKRGLVVHWRAADQNQKTTGWVVGAAGAFDRQKWQQLGGMDTLFRPAYEEDRDLCYRAAKHGWQILFAPKSVVNHQHESTNLKAFGRSKMAIMSYKNQFLFVWKNITDAGYLLKHFFWLPYHLLVTNWRSRGLLGVGFLFALGELPEALKSRKQVQKLFVKQDGQLI
ncbi:hypothetical protein COU97_02055 [Candidatus Shapirobacteria bacterium CG10_big_fil_rev_8_21_14_0_10_48_15]|uniref:Uncharacterized protein n=1 Tax=Candidatus Shapirobacteria bacterium CG10_big_fil_rev_8_21_14_0_10_48_15 TaxID=1974484 RepID=A0A2M8L6Z9_9BACT|nr:MAG: hypothetical protein COU97_02055 [Candidatus Shapirobacteria bacterium CG10_big_fil_rev_8_21_14_0_10_48_15]